MKIQIHWGQHSNKLSLKATEDELKSAANFLVEMCSGRDQDLVALEVVDHPLIRSLFTEHLCNLKFGLIEHKNDAQEIVSVQLLYKRQGWTLRRHVDHRTDANV